jgi:endo-1,4-beta-xylanase
MLTRPYLGHFGALTFTKFYLLLALLIVLSTCQEKGAEPVEVVQEFDPVLPESTQLKVLSDFPVGMQCYLGILDFPVPLEAVTQNYDSYTATTFFWNGIEPSPGNFDFNFADRAVEFGQKHALRLHGHALIYFQHSITPEYVDKFKGDQDAFEAMVKKHIQTSVGRYKGKIAGYDVVNEMVNDFKGTRYFNNTMEQFYRNDAAYEAFIGKCFTWAHEADPDAKLFYNEALLELKDPKRLNATLTLLSNLKAAGVPIHGIGTQMHTDIYCPISVIENTLKQLAATGLLVHVSELDVSVNNDSNLGQNFNYTALTPAAAEKQRDTYKAIVYAYRQQVPKAQQWGITLWDLMDHTSWLNQYRKEWPCLHDENCKKKLAYFGFAYGLLKK